MIHLEHPKWRAVRVMDEKSVEYLNGLLRQGWYVVQFDMDDVDYFVLRVPLETPTRSRRSDPFSFGARSLPAVVFDVDASKSIPTITVLVLTKGTQKNLQRATLARRSDEGRIDMAEARLPAAKWKGIITTVIEDGMLTIWEVKG